MGLEARRPAGGGVVGALVRKGRGSRNGVNATYLKDTKRVKKAGLNDWLDGAGKGQGEIKALSQIASAGGWVNDLHTDQEERKDEQI